MAREGESLTHGDSYVSRKTNKAFDQGTLKAYRRKSRLILETSDYASGRLSREIPTKTKVK